MTELEHMQQYYLEKVRSLEAENKRLKEALESIAKGMEINPPNSQAESVVGYFVGFAEAALKGNIP